MISSTPIINVLFWISYIIALIIGTEVFAYLWHRYGAHADYIPGIHDTHLIHHIIGLSCNELNPVHNTDELNFDVEISKRSESSSGDNNPKTQNEIHTLSSHEADEDFVWILLMMILFEIIMGIAVISGVIPGILALITIIVSLVVFWWNWWIHSAYHQKDHWLTSYKWFLLERERHYIHHYQPDKNYGIASHFSDQLLGTWIDPEI